MENFTVYNPTTLHFGKNVLSALGDTLKEYGNKVLLVYGKGSVKKSGLYDHVTGLLSAAGLEVFEYGGIKSNPIIEDVDGAAAIGRANHVDVILAVGGGSVIDSAKIISVTIPVNHTGWDFFSGKANAVKAVPYVAILTLAATGTEMNPFAVVSNHALGQKAAFGAPITFPKHSFLDPQLTVSVPRDYTAYGIADLIAHCFEAWFGIGEATLSDRIVISIVKEAMLYGPQLLNDLSSYDLRAKIMFAATMALNGTTMQGRAAGDWGVHSAGHILSLLYDVPHGASLTIVYPAWMRYFKHRIEGRIAELGTRLFDTPLSADESIHRIETFFRSIGCPVKLSEMNIAGDLRQPIFDGMVNSKVSGANMKMKEGDYFGLIDLFL
jgi:alcohol dehydrogenase YqhD (iron-dependent ADH family)